MALHFRKNNYYLMPIVKHTHTFMKKLNVLFALCAMLGTLCFTVSCEKDVPVDEPTPEDATTLTVSPLSLTFSADGGSQTIRIQSNTSWTVTPNAGWVTVSPMTGEGDATVVISTSELEKLEDRSCEIAVQTDDDEKNAVVNVVQSGAETVLKLDVSELIFEEMAKCERSVNVTSNTQWSITNVPEWLDVSTTNGNGNATVTFITSMDNNSSEALVGEITISTQSGISCQLSVSQKGKYIKDCRVSVENVVSLANSIAFELKFDATVSYFYGLIFYPESLELMTDSEILAELVVPDNRMLPDSKFVSGFDADPRTDYTLCFVAFDKNDKQGDLTFVDVSTPSDVNQPYAEIGDVYYTSSQFEWETTIGAYCSHYYMYADSGKTYDDLIFSYTYDAVIAWYLKEDITNNPDEYPRIVQSGGWTYNREITDLWLQIVTWGVGAEGDFSGIINNGVYEISDTRSSQVLNRVDIKEHKFKNFNTPELREAIRDNIVVVMK